MSSQAVVCPMPYRMVAPKLAAAATCRAEVVAEACEPIPQAVARRPWGCLLAAQGGNNGLWGTSPRRVSGVDSSVLVPNF
jgi:hypothetical protein